MTVAPEKGAETPEAQPPVPDGYVRLTVDGVTVDAPKGELIIRTAERIGVEIPRFCDHPLLDPAAACRQCLVEVESGGRPMPKPQPACAITVADGMIVRTQNTSEVANKAQHGVMELLLINHPLDCPICDKGGECPLQNQALAHGRADSRFVDTKRTFPKPIKVSEQVLLDRERCVLCQRCTRFSEEIAGDPFIELLERGAHQQIGTSQTAAIASTSDGQPFESYFSGNVIQICPVGALTSAAYRFRSRPFDLVSTPSVCEHCASGCAQRTDWRRGKVTRRLAGDDPDVNEEWNCDKGRFAFRYATANDRITRPLLRDSAGKLQPVSWTEALGAAAAGLAKARDGAGVGVLAGGRLTVEDAYAYAKFARIALRTNDIDFRARPNSAEELGFLAGYAQRKTVTYADIESAPSVLCVAFEPQDESPIVFLRLRKAARKNGTKVVHIGQFTTGSVRKTIGPFSAAQPGPSGALLACLPGAEAAAVDGLATHAPDVLESLRDNGSVLLVGERAAQIPGLFGAVDRLAQSTGARIAWVPRRAGERGALAAGAAPTLLPGGRLVTDDAARADVERAWGLDEGALPAGDGKSTDDMLAAAASGELAGLVVGGVDPDDLADPALANAALSKVDFLVSLELRPSAVTEHADVVLPIAPAVEKSGTYLNWEGRPREFGTTIDGTGALSDCRVLDTLAVEMDADLYTQTPAAAAADLAKTSQAGGAYQSTLVTNVDSPMSTPASPGQGQAVLATWRALLDNGSLQADEPHLAATAPEPRALLSSESAARYGVEFGRPVRVSTERGSIDIVAAQADLPDSVIWLPENSGPSTVRKTLGVGHGALVNVSAVR